VATVHGENPHPALLVLGLEPGTPGDEEVGALLGVVRHLAGLAGARRPGTARVGHAGGRGRRGAGRRHPGVAARAGDGCARPGKRVGRPVDRCRPAPVRGTDDLSAAGRTRGSPARVASAGRARAGPPTEGHVALARDRATYLWRRGTATAAGTSQQQPHQSRARGASVRHRPARRRAGRRVPALRRRARRPVVLGAAPRARAPRPVASGRLRDLAQAHARPCAGSAVAGPGTVDHAGGTRPRRLDGGARGGARPRPRRPGLSGAGPAQAAGARRRSSGTGRPTAAQRPG